MRKISIFGAKLPNNNNLITKKQLETYIRLFSISKKETDEIATLEKQKNELLNLKKMKVKNQLEEYEYDDFIHDYRLSLIENDDKFIKMFDGDQQLLKMREENEKSEKIDFAIYNFFGIIFSGVLIFTFVSFISNIDREMERIFPSYNLWFYVKSKSNHPNYPSNTIQEATVQGDLNFKDFLKQADKYLSSDKEHTLDNCAMYILILQTIQLLVDESNEVKDENQRNGDKGVEYLELEEFEFMKGVVNYTMTKLGQKVKFYSHVLGYENYIHSLLNMLALEVVLESNGAVLRQFQPFLCFLVFYNFLGVH